MINIEIDPTIRDTCSGTYSSNIIVKDYTLIRTHGILINPFCKITRNAITENTLGINTGIVDEAFPKGITKLTEEDIHYHVNLMVLKLAEVFLDDTEERN